MLTFSLHVTLVINTACYHTVEYSIPMMFQETAAHP